MCSAGNSTAVISPAGLRDAAGGPTLHQAQFSYQDARARNSDWGGLEQRQVPIFQSGAGQQHLADVQFIDGKQLLPDLDQVALSDGRQHLLVGHGGHQGWMPQELPPGRDGTRGNDDNMMPLAMQGGQLAHQFNHMSTVDSTGSPGQNAGTQLHNDGFLFHKKKARRKEVLLYTDGIHALQRDLRPGRGARR